MDARRLVPASVMVRVPVEKSKAASPILPGGRAPAFFQCRRPAIIKCSTRKRSPPSAMTIALAEARDPDHVAPDRRRRAAGRRSGARMGWPGGRPRAGAPRMRASSASM